MYINQNIYPVIRMNCPYTATMKFIQKWAGPYVPDVTYLKYEPVDVYFFDIYKNLNDYVGDDYEVSNYAASTVRGNLPIEVAPSLKESNLDDTMRTEVHGILRWTIGELGKKLDKKTLPELTQNCLFQLDENIKEYRQLVKPLKELHLGIHGKPRTQEDNFAERNYNTVNLLLNQLPENWITKKAAKSVQSSDKKTKKILTALNRSIRDVTEFGLTDGSEMQNIKSKKLKNPVKWLLFAEMAATAFADTTKLPTPITDSYWGIMGSTNHIVPKIIKHFEERQDLLQPVFQDVFIRGIEKMKKAAVQCGSYEQISELNRGKKLLDILNITSSDNYDAIKNNLTKQEKIQPVANSGLAKGKCPLGYSTKYKAA